MKLYNTLSKKIEEFIPNNKEYVTMYTCGPTVYNYAHIGNLKNYINSDVLEKSLEYLGYNVKRCMNITDVGHLSSDSDFGEDKMVREAKKTNLSVLEIAKFYTEEFFKDINLLNIKKPLYVVPATTCINDYIEIIKKLLNDKYAYISGGNVYFDISKYTNYYCLTNNSIDDMKTAVREDVDIDKNKRNSGDFVLWFTKSKFDNQDLKWDSPWGLGYPGWHIECSAISIKYLGEYLDIHSGGIDLIFPHHTNEIAQSEAYLQHKWCKYWVHNEYLNDINGKMSKSKGDFISLTYIINKGYNPMAYRLFCLQSHYRKILLFSYDALDQAQNTYNKLVQKIKKISKDSSELDTNAIQKYKNSFKDALSNDINTSNALTVLYDVIKSELNNNTKLYLISDFDKVLSLNLLYEDKISYELIAYIKLKIEERNEAKLNKNYALSDKIRDELKQKGIILKDLKEGTTYEIINGEII